MRIAMLATVAVAAATLGGAPLHAQSDEIVLADPAFSLTFSAGYIAPLVLDQWGWRGTFFIGGATPLLLAALLWAATP